MGPMQEGQVQVYVNAGGGSIKLGGTEGPHIITRIFGLEQNQATRNSVNEASWDSVIIYITYVMIEAPAGSWGLGNSVS